MNDIKRKEYFECLCGADSHIFIAEYTSDYLLNNTYKEFCIGTQANIHDSFWKRVKTAFLHILGKRQYNYYWDCSSLREKDVDVLIEMLQEYKAIKAKEFD